MGAACAFVNVFENLTVRIYTRLLDGAAHWTLNLIQFKRLLLVIGDNLYFFWGFDICHGNVV